MARRWNGWGDDANDAPLSARARGFLAERIGSTAPAVSATREAALQAVGASRLPASTGFLTDPATRLDHAFGQSMPDWIALRSGRVGQVADGVALPTSHDEAVAALEEAKRLGAIVIPYGGGTSVVGHLRVPEGERQQIEFG
jgi:alkyldihydroxyacetonephosphate synthase